jgi:4F5 protein related disordered region
MTFTGGNQRDLARQKNLKKTQETSKAKKADEKDGNKGLNLQERKQRYVLHTA